MAQTSCTSTQEGGKRMKLLNIVIIGLMVVSLSVLAFDFLDTKQEKSPPFTQNVSTYSLWRQTALNANRNVMIIDEPIVEVNATTLLQKHPELRMIRVETQEGWQSVVNAHGRIVGRDFVIEEGKRYDIITRENVVINFTKIH
jgi:hypothetical protein